MGSGFSSGSKNGVHCDSKKYAQETKSSSNKAKLLQPHQSLSNSRDSVITSSTGSSINGSSKVSLGIADSDKGSSRSINGTSRVRFSTESMNGAQAYDSGIEDIDNSADKTKVLKSKGTRIKQTKHLMLFRGSKEDTKSEKNGSMGAGEHLNPRVEFKRNAPNEIIAISDPSDVIESDNGKLELCFKVPEDMEIHAELHRVGRQSESLSEYVLQWRENDLITFSVILAERGDYKLHIYAGKIKEDTPLTRIYSYSVHTGTGAVSAAPFPEVPCGRLGPVVDHTLPGFQPATHNSPYIRNTTTSGELSIVFTTDNDLYVKGHLEKQTLAGTVLCDAYMFIEHVTGKVTFSVRTPEVGVYCLRVYARAQSSTEFSDDRLYNVHNSVIDTENDKDGSTYHACPYPEMYHHWTSECHLISPRGGVLAAGTTVEFAAKIPWASRVAIVKSNEWVQLYPVDGLWEGEVVVQEGESEIEMCAETSRGSGNFNVLLVYTVLDTES